jgi:tetratricopeptide (TPR) repeat protein
MLKIRQPRNAYDLLGLPWSATPVQIRARYRQLIRSHRKDLATPQLMEDERFREWTNSYLYLVSPERREYDRRLRQSRGMEQPPDLLSQLPPSRLMLVEAEAAFVRRRLNEAADLAKEALKQENRNAEGYALLGDIHREQGSYQNALTMYNYAIQFDPNNRRYWQLLEEVTALKEGRALPRRFAHERPSAFNRPASAWVGVGLAVIFVELSVFYLQNRWGEPAFFNLPINVIYAALGDGFLLGLVLAATSILSPFDDELVWYQVTGVGAETVPLGIFIAIPGIVFFWLAPVFYAIVAYLDEHFSLSVGISLFVCALVTVSFGLLLPRESRQAAYLLAGNFVFFGFMLGWLLGSVRRRVFEH